MANPDISSDLMDHAKRIALGETFALDHVSHVTSGGCSDISMAFSTDEPTEKHTNEWINAIENVGESASACLHLGSLSAPMELEKSKNPEPKKEDFLVPSNAEQHRSIVERLVKAGTLQAEAEQIIAVRKTAYNKACREHKKLIGKTASANEHGKAQKKSPGSQIKTRKKVTQMSEEHVN